MDHSAASDVKLMVAAEHDSMAYGVLCRRYADRVKGYHLDRCHDEAAAFELAAETFAQAWFARRAFRGEAGDSAAPWLYGIARNVVLQSVHRGRLEDAACRRLGLLRTVERASVAPVASWLDGIDELPGGPVDEPWEAPAWTGTPATSRRPRLRRYARV